EPASRIPSSAPQGVDPPQACCPAARGVAPAAQMGASGEEVAAGYPRPRNGRGHRVGAAASRGLGGATSEARGGVTNRERQRRDAAVGGCRSHDRRFAGAGTRPTPRTGEQSALEASSTKRSAEARGIRAARERRALRPLPELLAPIPHPPLPCPLLRA